MTNSWLVSTSRGLISLKRSADAVFRATVATKSSDHQQSSQIFTGHDLKLYSKVTGKLASSHIWVLPPLTYP
jgi:hypothetical protein